VVVSLRVTAEFGTPQLTTPKLLNSPYTPPTAQKYPPFNIAIRPSRTDAAP